MPWFPGTRKIFSPCRTVVAALPVIHQTSSRVTTHFEQTASVRWPQKYKSIGVRSGDCEGHKNIQCPLITGDCQPVSNGDQGRYISLDSWTFVADTSRLKRHTTDELSRCYSPSNNPDYRVFNEFLGKKRQRVPLANCWAPMHKRRVSYKCLVAA